MTTKKTHDIERMEADYRGGVLSLQEVANVHGISKATLIGHAKRRGWTRDIKQKALVLAEAKMQAEQAGDLNGEQFVIEAQAQAIITVVREHKGTLSKLRKLVDRTAAKIEEQLNSPDLEIKPSIMSGTLVNLANAAAKLISSEREAYGLDTHQPPAEESYEERLKKLMDQAK
ncbi:MAG: hypothetical protein ACRC2H_01025 [Silanimonas sp.]